MLDKTKLATDKIDSEVPGPNRYEQIQKESIPGFKIVPDNTKDKKENLP